MLDSGNDLLVLGIVAGISLLVGMILGVFIAGGLGMFEQRRDKYRSLDELFRLWRRKHSSRLGLEIDGEFFDDPDQLSIGQFKQVMKTLQELSVWLGGNSQSIFQDFQTHQAKHNSGLGEKVEQQISLPDDPTVKPQENHKKLLTPTNRTNSAGVLSNQDRSMSSISLKSPGLFAVFKRAIRRNKPIEIQSTQSLADQINTILQERLSSNSIVDVDIQILEVPDRGVIVTVGDDEYDGIDEVPDDEVRTLIRDCVQEWEKQQEENAKRY